MANGGGDWNTFMQSRRMRLLMDGICVFFCVYYGVDALMEMLTPERAEYMMELMASIGPTGYYAVTIARMLVCLGTGVAFARMFLHVLKEKDE